MKEIYRYWLSPCGIDCSKCSIHLRTDEELEYWKDKKDLELVNCDGCRATENKYKWTEDCEIFKCCVLEKKLYFCSECEEFICSKLGNWISGLEHHIIAINKLKQMKEIGTDNWLSLNNYI